MPVLQLPPEELAKRLQQGMKTFLLDVREPFEHQYANIAGSVLIPMNEIQQRITELEKKAAIVVICHHGIRSQQVAEFLVYSGFQNIFNLRGGIDAWSCQCDPSVLRY